MIRLLEKIKTARLLSSADLYNGNPTTSWLTVANWRRLLFLVIATPTTGQATIKVQAASDNAGTGAEDIPFRYRKSDSAGSPADKLEAYVDVAATGFQTDTAESHIYHIEVDSDDLPDGKPFVALNFTEDVDAPVPGAVVCLGGVGRHEGPNLPTLLA
jgi:hypothetical protein